mgnify:CR=1 FL=1
MDTRIENRGWVHSLAEQLCALTRGPLPPAAVEAASHRLFHAVGVSLANNQTPAAAVAWAALARTPGHSFAFGHRERIAAEDAAFVNATIGHGSLLEDCGPGGLREGSHPGTFIIPAALAIAEEIDASGAALARALVVGYEAVGRIGLAGPHDIVQRRFRPLGVMGAFGAAAAVADLLGADPDQMAAALSIAANLAGGSTQGIFEGSMEPYFQSAFAARNGIAAARLGIAGAQTATGSLEGEFGFFQTYGGVSGDPAPLFADTDQLAITRLGTKSFAACLQNQETVAVVVAELDTPLSEPDVARVTIRRPAMGTNGLNSPGVSRSKPFGNMLMAQMSARFTAAAALLGKPVTSPMFFAEHHGDPEIERLTDRIALEPTDDGSVSVVVELTDGTVRTFDSDQSGTLFPAPDRFPAMFTERATPVLGSDAAKARDMIANLDTLGSIRTLTAIFGEAAR